MDFKIFIESFIQAKTLADKIATRLHCELGGSCPFFAEWATKVFLKSGIKDFSVVEGWVKVKTESFWRQHTWIEMDEQKIDPTFAQFNYLGQVNYVTRVKHKYTPTEYLKLSDKYPEERKRFKQYIFVNSLDTMTSFRTFIEDTQLVFPFARVQGLSWQEIKDRKLFGPVYHGTTQDAHENIAKSGFQTDFGKSRNGYYLLPYALDMAAPEHHLGFGVYFTTLKSVAKKFNNDTTRGLKQYWLDVPRMEIINFGSKENMMKWWIANGYNMQLLSLLQAEGKKGDELVKLRHDATMNLTKTLRSKYDAVWFKGRSIRTLLDGDQIVVFDPSNIYQHDPSKDDDFAIVPGRRFVVKGTKAVATVISVRPATGDKIWDDIVGKSSYLLSVKIKNNEDIKNVYYDKVKNVILKHHMQFIKDISDRRGMTIEESLEQYLNYFLTSSLASNFPSALIGKFLKPGERLK